MTYSKTTPTVYAIFFRDARILKVGMSGGQRWRNWVARGAEVIALEEFDNTLDARIFETRTHRHLSALMQPAFKSAAEAREFTSIVAGGWTEFYLVPTDMEPLAALVSMPEMEV